MKSRIELSMLHIFVSTFVMMILVTGTGTMAANETDHVSLSSAAALTNHNDSYVCYDQHRFKPLFSL